MGPVGLATLAAAVLAGSGVADSSRPAGLTSAKLLVSGASQTGGAGGSKVRYRQQQLDDPVAKLTVYVPKGYQVTTAQRVGTKLGTAAGTILSADLRSAVPVTGTVDVSAPADFAPQATACTGTEAHSDTWTLRFSISGTPLVVPVFVDLITTGPLSTFATAQIVMCLLPGDLPPETPGRAPFGAKVLMAEFTSSALTNPTAPGAYRWRATVTPYSPNTGKINASETVEVQSVVALPTRLTLKAKSRRSAKAGSQTVSYSGALRSNGTGLADASIDVLRGATALRVKKFKTQSTSENGTFEGSFAVPRGRGAGFLFLLAKASLAEQDLGASECLATFSAPAWPLPIPCRNATVGAFSVTSNSLRVRIPAAAKGTKR